jgi:pimeloyl-ACP methyl ester carboxylesterase
MTKVLGMRSRRYRSGLLAGAILLVAALAAFRLVRHDGARWHAIVGGRWTDLRCDFRIAATPVAFTTGGLHLAGDLYLPARPAGSPAVLLLHGATPRGRKLPIYRELADRLRAHGFTVVAIDSRGFDESEKPHDLHDPAAFDFPEDVIAALDSLPRWAPVDPQRVYVVAHSFGAGIGLAAAGRDARIRKVVLIGPARRLTERFFAPGASDRAYWLQRWQHDMGLPGTLDFPMWSSVMQPLNIETYAAPGAAKPHPPVFLIDGEREDPRDRAFLRNVARHMPAPVDYWTVPGTHHYLSIDRFSTLTATWMPERLASAPCYDRRVVGPFADRVAAWLLGPAAVAAQDSTRTGA